MGGILIAGMSAFQLLKKTRKLTVIFQKSMRIGFAVALFGSITVLIAGDEQ